MNPRFILTVHIRLTLNQHESGKELSNTVVIEFRMSEIQSMWFCPTCETWVGYELNACGRCDRGRPILPVTSDNVPVKHSKRVIFTHCARAKFQYVTQTYDS